MDNPHMFDELTNRLNKVKRPDSGIHNSGEFIGENEKLDKSDEQADSGRDSDPAEPADVDAADGSGATKKGGILKSFKKMFKIRRKTKTGKIKDDKDHDDDEKVISSQYKAASEPDLITSGSSKEPDIPRSNTGMPPKRYIDSPNMNDFTSDDEETRIDEKKSSLKDAPSFIRSSLRKLKLKKKKSGGMDSNEVTPTSVKRTNSGVPPPISPKKSPKKPRSSSRSSHSSDQTEPRNDSFNKDFNNDPDDVYLSGKSSRTDSLSSQPVAVNLKDDLQAYQPVIESTAAKDKIRIAPRGRKRPTRVRTQSKAAEISEKLSPLAQISEDDFHDGAKPLGNKSILAEAPKKHVKEIPKKSAENKLETNANTHFDINGSVLVDDKHKKVGETKYAKNNTAIEKTFDSVISSLESARNKPDVLIPKKSSPDSKTRALTDPTTSPLPKVLPKPEKPVSKHTSRESIDNISYNSRRNTDSSTHSRKSIDSTKGSVENLDLQSVKSVSLGDLVIEAEDASPARRSKSFQKEIEINSVSQRKHLSEVEPLKDDSPDKNRYDKYRKSRSQTIPDNRNVKQTISSKSVEDVSILNKENYRRSGHFIEPLGTPYQKDVKRENLINETTRLASNDENIRRSKEHLKKSSSRHSLNETTFAITSTKNSQDPIIPYGSSNISSELSSSPDKPRKLQKRTSSKDDVSKSTARKPRPQSVTIRSTDTDVIFGKVSGARSYGDIRSLIDMPESEKSNELPSISKKSKPVVNETSRIGDKPILSNTGKSKSVDVTECVVTGSNVPEFKRMSLRKTPKAEDYLPKEMLDMDTTSVEVEEENPVLSSIKTTLKHVETKANVDISREAKQEEVVEQCTKIESEFNLNKEKKLPSPIVVEAKQLHIDVSGPVEIRETKDTAPEFHRISLKKVEKRDDYLEKEPATVNLKADNGGQSDQMTEKNENKANSSENIVSPHNDIGRTLSSPNEEDIPREKPKPPVKAKPFQFQSHDVKGSESKPQSNPDKPKAVPLSQTGKLPYFRKSVDIQENPHGSVPAWIAMAREKQRDEASDKDDDEIAKEAADKTEDITSESLVKPSAFKPKPSPMPKPAVASKPETSPTSTSPPAVAKKPPPVSQRPSLGRFNAKTDLPKDACMVCRKTVYVLERCEVNKRTLHRACAKCHVCARTLNVGDIFINDEKVWCKQHR